MRYVEYSPPPRLARLVDRFWILDGPCPATPDVILPDGRAELIFHYGDPFVRHHPDGIIEQQPGAVLAGQIVAPLALCCTGRAGVAAIRLQPGALRAVLGSAAYEITGRLLRLDDALPLAAAARERLADARDDRMRTTTLEWWMTRLVVRAPQPGIEAALKYLARSRGPSSLASVAGGVGISTRQLERRFKEEVGLTPKTYRRIVRIHEAAQRIALGEALASVALSCGYYDQSHMSAEFSRLADMAPAAWRRHSGGLARLFVGV